MSSRLTYHQNFAPTFCPTGPISVSINHSLIQAAQTRLAIGGDIAFWTVMERVVWQRLQTTGTLICPRDKADSDPLFQQAYAWMRGAVAGAGIEPPAPGLSPWWSWVRREPERGMPHAEDLQGLDNPVVLQLAVPARDLIPSCFDLRHYVLNRWYVAATEEGALDFDGLHAVCEDSSPAAAQLQARIRASWYAVFDLD